MRRDRNDASVNTVQNQQMTASALDTTGRGKQFVAAMRERETMPRLGWQSSKHSLGHNRTVNNELAQEIAYVAAANGTEDAANLGRFLDGGLGSRGRRLDVNDVILIHLIRTAPCACTSAVAKAARACARRRVVPRACSSNRLFVWVHSTPAAQRCCCAAQPCCWLS